LSPRQSSTSLKSGGRPSAVLQWTSTITPAAFSRAYELPIADGPRPKSCWLIALFVGRHPSRFTRPEAATARSVQLGLVVLVLPVLGLHVVAQQQRAVPVAPHGRAYRRCAVQVAPASCTTLRHGWPVLRVGAPQR